MNYKWIYTIPQGLIHMFFYENIMSNESKLELKTVVSKFLDYNFLSKKRLIFFKFWSR